MTSSAKDIRNGPSAEAAATPGFAEWTVAVIAGALLAAFVWREIVAGGSLIGGDIYPYFLPQKQVVGEAFAAGRIPLWNSRTSLGYPLHAESQAAVFYPFTQVLYRIFSAERALHFNILAHYWLAFVFAWRFGRSQYLRQPFSLLAAMIYVYGWFPARVSLEWSIIGGMWLPLILWQTERLTRSPDRRRLVPAALCIGIQLLAGHFALAFITQLTAGGLVLLRVFGGRRINPAGIQEGGIRRISWFAGAAFCGFLLAAVQLLPTYELKRLSQRAPDAGQPSEASAETLERTAPEFDAAYGHMPPLYVSQVLASWWYWHSPEIEAAGTIRQLPLSVDADTNEVEANLYWGQLPLLFLICWWFQSGHSADEAAAARRWWLITAASLIYATGWLVPVTRFLPGFGYFMGPARYSVAAALGGSLIAGLSMQHMFRNRSATVVRTAVAGVCLITLPDLLWSSRVADAVILPEPLLSDIDGNGEDASEALRDVASGRPLRVLAPMPNVPNLWGLNSVPEYLGIGPAAYYSGALDPVFPSGRPPGEFPTPDDRRDWHRLGLTHLLLFDPLDEEAVARGALELVGGFSDRLTAIAIGQRQSPLWLYRITDADGPVQVVPSDAGFVVTADLTVPEHRVIEVDMSRSGVVRLVELSFPGWQVTVDGESAPARSDGLFRSVECGPGRHRIEWTYRPASFRFGSRISLIVFVGLVALIAVPRRQTLRDSETR